MRFQHREVNDTLGAVYRYQDFTFAVSYRALDNQAVYVSCLAGCVGTSLRGVKSIKVIYCKNRCSTYSPGKEKGEEVETYILGWIRRSVKCH